MQRLFALAEQLRSRRIGVLMVYISEAHTDDCWPIGKDFFVGETRVNTKNYSDLATRLARAAQFRELSQCPFPVYSDNEQNTFSVRFQAWPDKFYFVENKSGLVLEQQEILRAQVQLDSVEMLQTAIEDDDYLREPQAREPEVGLNEGEPQQDGVIT